MMKQWMLRVLTGMFAFSLLGFGCSSGSSVSQSGPWWLSFDLPSGWEMYAGYSKNVVDPSTLSIDRTMTDVVIQSTKLPIVLPGKTAGKDVVSFVDKNFSYVRIYRYDVNLTKIPEGAVDMGKGFSKVEKDGKTTYYFKGQYGNYKFVVSQEGQDLSTVEKVILTAKESADPAKAADTVAEPK